jgi:hypothetical protein
VSCRQAATPAITMPAIDATSDPPSGGQGRPVSSAAPGRRGDPAHSSVVAT